MEPLLDHFEEELEPKIVGTLQKRFKIIGIVVLSTINPILLAFYNGYNSLGNYFAYLLYYWIVGTALFVISYLVLVTIAAIIGALLEFFSERWAYPFNNLVDLFPLDAFLLGVNVFLACVLIYSVIT